MPQPVRPGTRVGILVNADGSHSGAETLTAMLQTALHNRALLKPIWNPVAGGDGLAPRIEPCGSDLARLAKDSDCDYLAVVDPGIRLETPRWADRLCAFAGLEGIGLVTGMLLDRQGLIAEAGLYLDLEAVVCPAFKGCDPNSDDCPRQVFFTREVAAVSGAFAVLSKTVFDELGGISGCFSSGWLAWADLSLRARQSGLRNLVCSQTVARQTEQLPSRGASFALDRAVFNDRWKAPVANDVSRRVVVSSVEKASLRLQARKRAAM
jgi:GT2 family glycosyltransferase